MSRSSIRCQKFIKSGYHVLVSFSFGSGNRHLVTEMGISVLMCTEFRHLLLIITRGLNKTQHPCRQLQTAGHWQAEVNHRVRMTTFRGPFTAEPETTVLASAAICSSGPYDQGNRPQVKTVMRIVRQIRQIDTDIDTLYRYHGDSGPGYRIHRRQQPPSSMQTYS